MNIVTFCDVDESIIDSKHKVEYFNSGCSGDAQVAIIDINSIFEFEEKKGAACGDKFVSLAVIDDETDYDAFKNFGIDAWINRNQFEEVNGIIDLVEKKLLS